MRVRSSVATRIRCSTLASHMMDDSLLPRLKTALLRYRVQLVYPVVISSLLPLFISRYFHGKVVHPSCDIEVSRSHRLDYFKNNFMADQPRFSSPCRPQHHISTPREHPEILARIGVSVMLLLIYSFTFPSVFTARCTLVQSAVLRSHVVCLSVLSLIHI